MFAICAQVFSVCVHDFHKKNNEKNESHNLCQVRGKHTVGGIVFYKHLFLVSISCPFGGKRYMTMYFT